MKVWAFGCVHLATADTAVYLWGHPLDYKPCWSFLELFENERPDILISLGDLWEPLYDSNEEAASICPPLWALLNERDGKLICGNHDRQNGQQRLVYDNVVYEHGHHKCWPLSATTENVRRAYKGLHCVHAHTHHPRKAWPLDVGSLTFTETFGEIIDGYPHLRKIGIS